MRTPLHLAVALLVIAATTAGCGSDSPSSAAEKGTAVSTTDHAGGTTEGAATLTDSTTAASPDRADPCGFAEYVAESGPTLDDVWDPETDPAERNATLTAYVAEVEQWASTMPTEIADDFAATLEYLRTMQESLAANGYDLAAMMDDPAGMAALQEAMSAPDPDAFEASGERLNAWFLGNCGIDLAADDGIDGSAADPLAGGRLPFDPCEVPAMVDLTALDGLAGFDLNDGSKNGAFFGDASLQLGCSWQSDDFSLLALSAIAFTDPEAAARDIRTGLSLFGAEIEPLDDRFPAPTFAAVFDTLVTVYVLGTGAPFGVSLTRTVPDGDPTPDLETTYAIAELLAAELEPVPGGLDLPLPETDDTAVIDAEPFDSENAEFAFDPCDAVTTPAVTALVDTGGSTGSQGSALQRHYAADTCSAWGATPEGIEVDVTLLAVAFDDIEAARADIIDNSNGEVTANLDGLPEGSLATTGGFWGDAVWVLDTDAPFAVAVTLTDTDPVIGDLVLAVKIAIAFLFQ
jgi:hypothetical protein